MMIKKSIDFGNINGISYANGKVTFNKVSMNVYCYVVDGMLVDTGPRSLMKELTPFLLGQDYEQVVITHHHEDHTGCASIIEQQRSVPIYIHQMSVEECKKPAHYPMYRKLFWGKRKPFHARGLDSTISSRTSTWDVIETPGHAEDHIVLLNQQTGQLFTGDLFVQPKTKLILRNESIPTILRSIEKVLTYDFNEMYCCHAGFVKNGREMLQRKRDYLLNLQGQVLRLYEEGYNPRQIHEALFKRKYPITKISFGEWDSLHMVTSILTELAIKK
ncbi:MBL fold metallo-hydrolase [Lysinibacillus endophyticus]|uniref:MBL fold metallo-hydrolase n=1 Tax=Ureibacillus endophyticus TaxID=1978490 RepID=UPI00209F720F|nr:MBL fold metallo-hydrolase [Lysinibacillus endophyticus]MCP1144337.1 MBL fold metallo-hydrolase [Lysinibacillus endophyticus]